MFSQGILGLVLTDQRKDVELFGNVGMILAQFGFANLEAAEVEWFCLVKLELYSIQFGQMEKGRVYGVIELSELGFENPQILQINWLCLVK